MAIYKYDKATGKVVEISTKPNDFVGRPFEPFYSEDMGVMISSERQFDRELKKHGKVRTQEIFSKSQMINKMDKGTSKNPDFLRQRDRLIKHW